MPTVYWRTSTIDNTNITAQTAFNTDPIDVSYDDAFSFKIIIDAGSSADVKLEYQVIESGQGDKSLVGGPKDTEDGMSWVTPNTGGVLLSNHTSGAFTDGFKPMVTMWLRFRVTGNAGNHNTTTYVTVKIGSQSSC